MDNIEILATLYTQNTGRRQPIQKQKNIYTTIRRQTPITGVGGGGGGKDEQNLVLCENRNGHQHTELCE